VRAVPTTVAGSVSIQSWDFEGSNDGSEWTVLRVHKDDFSLRNEGFGVAAWEVEGFNQAHRHFRIRMTGKCSYGNYPDDSLNHELWESEYYGDHCLCCAGIELWGRLLSK
jgi:hypothetical protein